MWELPRSFYLVNMAAALLILRGECGSYSLFLVGGHRSILYMSLCRVKIVAALLFVSALCCVSSGSVYF